MATGSPVGWRMRLAMALARLTWRRLFVRVIAVLACLVALVGLYASARAYREVERAEALAHGQLGEVAAAVRQAAASLRGVAASADHAAATADDAQRTLDSAALTARDAAATFDETATAMEAVTALVAFVQPVEVDASFRDTAAQLRTLADTVDTTGDALGQNAGDLRAIGRDAGAMAGQLDRVADQLGQLAGEGPGPSGLLQLTGAARLIIAWSAVLHLLILGLGLSHYLTTTDGFHAPRERR